MREIAVSKIRDTVRDLCIKANTVLRPDIVRALESAKKRERKGRVRDILQSLIENAKVAREKRIAML